MLKQKRKFFNEEFKKFTSKPTLEARGKRTKIVYLKIYQIINLFQLFYSLFSIVMYFSCSHFLHFLSLSFPLSVSLIFPLFCLSFFPVFFLFSVFLSYLSVSLLCLSLFYVCLSSPSVSLFWLSLFLAVSLSVCLFN